MKKTKKLPRIIITVENGVITSVWSTRSLEYRVYDYDAQEKGRVNTAIVVRSVK